MPGGDHARQATTDGRVSESNRIDLEHELAELSGHVYWNPDTGELYGPLAELITRLAREAAARGYVTTPPHPTSHPIGRDPLRSRRDMALILSQHWPVPEPLRGELPKSAPPDADGNVDVLY